MEEKKKQLLKRSLIIALIVLLVAFGWFRYKMQQVMKLKMQQQQAAMAVPEVVLDEVQEANISLDRAYVGKVEAIQTVNVVPSVVGKIAAVNFKEGSMVRAGQVLFTIEHNDYAATVALRRAQLAQAKANLANAQSYLKRMKTADPRSISAAEVDKAKADFLAAQANVASCQASLQIAEIDLARTSVRSPITGRIGKALLTKGNYVTPQSTPLAVVVQEDPVRVDFGMPYSQYLERIADFEKKGAVLRTKLRLSDGQEIEASGTRDFENNTVDPQTGTIAIRLQYSNKQGLLTPGSTVRVYTKTIHERLAKYIPQEAVMSDLQGDFVYVVDKSNNAAVRRVKLGDEYGNSRIVESGVETGEKVIVQGVQRVRPGAKVKVVANQKSKDTDAEKAKDSTLDLKPVNKKDAENAVQGADNARKVPAAMPTDTKQK